MKRLDTQRIWGWFYLLPAALLILLIFAYPIASNILLSLTDKRLLLPSSEWTGMTNYRVLLSDPEFWISLRNTVTWTAGSVSLQLCTGVFVALLLFFNPRLRGFFRTVLIIPWMIPVIVIAIIWRWLLNDLYGVLPYLAVQAGLTEETFSVFSRAGSSMVAIILIDVWRAYPLIMLSTLAGLQTIPRDHFEVARVEGASAVQTFSTLILPSIAPIVGTMVILRTIWTMNDFARVFLLTGGGPGIATQTVPIFIYRMSWFSRNIGRGAAASVLVLVVLIGLTALYVKTLRVERHEA